jgi:hypothetical protein
MYIKIHHIYTTILQRNAYILTICLSYAMSTVYQSDYFGFMLYCFV